MCSQPIRSKHSEGLVDEIEQMSAIGVDAIRRGRDQKVGQGRRRRSGGNRCEQRALGRVPRCQR